MALVGLSKPYFAPYTDNGDGTVTYSGGIKVEKAVETHITLNDSGDNILYGDNGPAESDKQFSGGTLDVVTTDLPLDAAAVIFGLTVEEITLDGDSAATGQRLIFGESQSIPYGGYGVVAKGIRGGVPYYMAAIYLKVQFSNPGEDYVTQGETVSWQTPSLKATLMRDDTPAHNWRDWVRFPTEEQAERYIKQVLNITDVPEG